MRSMTVAPKNNRQQGWVSVWLGSVVALVVTVAALSGCGAAARNLAKAEAREAGPVPGTLEGHRLLTGTIQAIDGDRISIETGEQEPRILSLQEGGDEAIGLLVGDQVQIVVNEQDRILDYQRPRFEPPTKVLRGSLAQPLPTRQYRAVVRVESGRDISFYVRPAAMTKLSGLEIGESAEFALDRTYMIVDVRSLGKPREGTEKSPGRSVVRRVEGEFVTLGGGTVRLRMRRDEIQAFPVRPLIQPALEQVFPNDKVSVFLDATGHVVDMVRLAKAE